METLPWLHEPLFSIYAQIWGKMETRATKNGATSILLKDSNSAILKRPLTEFSISSNDFYK